ncbi:hypothetical protein PR048_004088 [Dryococelus australis]|uniref:Uncharacterized protein n=1 Tax=Dryococelus australis TaxID=614101 RepID=A0ABQ9I4K8_9NEOP|nr:hypothetical protein PR048_004088 [Dryococelus australis]
MKYIEEQQHFYPKNSTHFPSDGTNDRSPLPNQIMLPLDSYSAAVLDGIAQLKALHKPAHVKTCHDLAIEFNRMIEPYLLKYNETHLVFVTYLEGSLKNSTRKKELEKQCLLNTISQILPIFKKEQWDLCYLIVRKR